MTYYWYNTEPPNDVIEQPWYAQGLDAQELGVGKALTYAEKYAILKMLNIPTSQDDPDAHAKEETMKIQELNPLIAEVVKVNDNLTVKWVKDDLAKHLKTKYRMLPSELDSKSEDDQKFILDELRQRVDNMRTQII